MKVQKSQPPTFRGEVAAAVREGPRLYFAPIIGAINAVRMELRRVSGDRALARRR